MARELTVLMVDDEKKILELMEMGIEEERFKIKTAHQPGEAMRILKEERIDILVTDLKMPGITGMELLKFSKKTSPETEVVMVTAYGSAESAVEAMKSGAYDYIIKPFKIEEMELLLRRVAEKIDLKESNQILREEVQGADFGEIIGNSPALRSVLDRVRRAASSSVTVLITGESGTGKELVARAIHKNSPRAKENYVSVNCAAIPKDLIESELFGHEKGSFTGATESRIGKFEYADKGTLFLDEIGELSLSAQSKFLRVLQEQEFERVGGNRKIRVDVRIVAATNRDLRELVERGEFREDLYYRINVFPTRLPPLRERKEDIEPLARAFFRRERAKMGVKQGTLSAEILDILIRYDWPGNIRELQNAIAHACVLAGAGEILPEHLPDQIPRLQPGLREESTRKMGVELPDEGICLEEVEKQFLQKAMEKVGGNQTRAARLLGISRRSLGYRLKKFKLVADEEIGE